MNPEVPVQLNLQKLAGQISKGYRVMLMTPMVLVFDYEGHEISLFQKGRMLIKNVHSEEEALKTSQAVARIISE